MASTLRRGYWREAICQWLEQYNPVQSRWLQEHPRRPDILNELTTDAIDLRIHATQQRDTGPEVRSFWKAISESEVESSVLSSVLEAPELWPDLADDYPRTPLLPPAAPTMLRTIPGSGPTRTPSPRET